MITDIDDLKKQLNSPTPSEAMQAEKEAAALAEQGNVEAAEMLVSVYADGTPALRADRVKEFKYTKMAAELGSAFSRYWLANLQRQSKDFAGALENARLAHQMGESNAATLLARMMLAGEGQPAKPLDALQLLSESVEGGCNTDAAILLAEVYLGGKHIPCAPQNAYDVLQRQAGMFDIMRHVSPPTYARSLYLKAEAIRMGATPAAGESYADLIGKAAQFGEEDAVAVSQGMKNDAEERQREAEWEAIARFPAYGGKWKMFPNIGRLVASVSKSHTSVSSFNGNVSTTTSHWRVATFETASGRQFTASIPARDSLVQGRAYAVLFVGPENEDSGVPTTIFDLEDGSVTKANGNIVTAYPKNSTKLLAFLAGFALVWMVFAGLALLASATPFGLIWLGVTGTLIYKLRKKRRGGYDEAVQQAGYFFGKHCASLR
ncbi:tetratricopeptide repeat protein [Telluria sp. B2]